MFRHSRIIKESCIFDTTPEGGNCSEGQQHYEKIFSASQLSKKLTVLSMTFFITTVWAELNIVGCMLWTASAERHPLKESLCSQRAKGSFPDGELNESSQKVRMVTEPLRKHRGRGRLGAPYSPFKSCYANKYILGIVAKPQSGQVLS